jgi:Cys-rich protein (TIGR01571 family)
MNAHPYQTCAQSYTPCKYSPLQTYYMMAPDTSATLSVTATDPGSPVIGPAWSTGLCDCCGQGGNCGFFCLAALCPGIAQATLLTRLGIFESCALPGLVYFVFDVLSLKSYTFLVPILFSLRMNLANKLRRDEGECGSICKVTCCYPCAMAQIQRDARDRNYKFQEPEDYCHMALAIIGNVQGNAISTTSAPPQQNAQGVSQGR